MKRFWIALLACAMIAGLAVSASAADIKFSGSYYVMGATADNWGLGDKDDGTTFSAYAQRLRMGMAFKVAEGLTLNTRFDALEGRWGQFGTYGSEYTHADVHPDEENISFDRVWVDFAVPFGKFSVGRQNSAAWGTIFGNNDFDSEQITFTTSSGPWDFGARIEKFGESWGTAGIDGTLQADGDYDGYHAWVRYRWNSGIAGFKVQYNRNDSTSAYNFATNAGGYKSDNWNLQPYFQATFGPVYVEGELNYVIGGYRNYEDGANVDDVDQNAFNAYIHAKADIKNFYVGGLYAFVQGQDPDDDNYTVSSNGGRSWNPTLILWNEYSNKWAGQLGFANGAANSGLNGEAMTNAHLGQLYAGFKPIPKLNIMASVAYARADEGSDNRYKSGVKYDDTEIGWEADLTASYKIYDNLSYTVGVGYLWAGDYWKADNANAGVDDTYLLLNKLDLNF